MLIITEITQKTASATIVAGLALSFAERVTLQLILERLWILQNAIYVVLGLTYVVPASVYFYLNAFIDVVTTDTVLAEDLSEEIFDFSHTEPYNL